MGIDFTNMLKRSDMDGIELLPTHVFDDRVDMRFFLVAGGKRVMDDSKATYGEDTWLDDVTPPAKQIFTVEKFFT